LDGWIGWMDGWMEREREKVGSCVWPLLLTYFHYNKRNESP
jgi:hypothetical protein